MRPFLLASLALLATAQAERIVYTSPRFAECGDACKDAVTALTFADTDKEADYYQALLGSTYTMTSVVACMSHYCTPAEVEASWKSWAEAFSESGLKLGPMSEYATSSEGWEVVNILPPPKDVFNASVMVDRASWEAGFKTEREWDMQMIYHHAYGWAMYLLLGVMVVIGLGNRAWELYVSARPARLDAEALAPRASDGVFGRAYTWYRGKIGVPATFGYRHLQPWGMLSIPTRIQAILVFIYVALNFIWSCTNYHLFNDNLYWPDAYDEQLARYVADRTGIMAFYNLPLLWVLGGRNDVFMWITGWSFPSCNLFHRWVARIATLQAIAHSAAYTWILRASLAASFKERYWATGVFATVTMSLILPLSIRPLRERAYEAFLVLHIALALATLVLLFYHVEIFGTDYYGYLWACVAVWIFDRVLRVVRIVFLSKKGNTIARITHDAPTGLIRLAVTTRRMITPSPGDYYFLYSPRSIKPWENHPFTLASWYPTPGGTELHFLAKPHGGATRALRNRIATHTTHTDGLGSGMPMTVLLEGPYGTKHNLEGFDRVLLISGGSGITALLPYVHALSKAEHGIKHLRLVWAVRDRAFAADVLAHELAPDNFGETRVEVYISQESGEKEEEKVTSAVAAAIEGVDALQHDSSSDLSTRESAQGSDKLEPVEKARHATIRGRPSVAHLLAQEIALLVGDERLGVLACGPWGMMDDLRQAIALSYGNREGQVSGARLEYFEEAFTW